MQWHPYAKLFPMLSDTELQTLADDIRVNGLKYPVVIDSEDRILDGRNRAAACTLAGVDPTLTVFKGTDREALQFVLSANLHRRHLTESQRAMVAAELANMPQGDRTDKGQPSANLPKVSQPEAAKALNVSTRSVTDAKKVQKKGTPELQEAVKAGNVSVSKAAKIAELPKPQQAKAIQTGIPKPVQRYPDSDLFAQWLETIRMRTDGILQQFGSFKALLDRPGWDHNEDGTLHPILAGLQITLTKFEEEFAQWRNAHGK